MFNLLSTSTSTLTAGQAAPDLTLQTVEGESTQLSEIWSDAPSSLLIFLRHLG